MATLARGERSSKPFDLKGLGSDWTVQKEANGRSYAAFTKDILQSPNDKRDYRLIVLENGLRALLISDPKTDKAAAALSVGIGHLSDPDDLPGLAHFLEHMLFLGSSRYPDEADYKTFLSAHGGSTNAFTSMAETLYHFDCTPAALYNNGDGALSRHSQFFTAPLFDPSCTEREVNAVDSEFRRNLQLDARRLFQLGKATSAAGHAYTKFGTGSKDTLWHEPVQRGEDVRQRLIEWYSDHYSANLMSLVILSSHTTEELTQMALSEYSDVPNFDLQPPTWTSPVFTDQQFKTEVSYRTIKDAPSMRLEFPLPDLSAFWRTKPGQFLTHYVGHEGESSILAELKRRGWATSLSAGSSSGASGFDFFKVDISLSAVGLAHYREVAGLVLEYIRILASTPLKDQQWAFDENAQLGKIAWRWQEHSQPTPTVRSLASRMTQNTYPARELLIGPWYATQFDEKAISSCLELLTLDKCRLLIGSKEPLDGRDYWTKTERYYGTEYDTRPLEVLPPSKPFNLALPGPNIFVPDRLETLTDTPAVNPTTRPSLIRQTTAGSRLFFKRDDTWLVPRGTASFLLRSPVVDRTAVNAIKSQFVAMLVEESLSSYSYDATLAGLSFAVGNEADSIHIVVSGYSEKLATLLQGVVERLAQFSANPSDFDLIHDRLTRAYKNANQNNPSTIADTHLRHLTRETHWTYDERLQALEGLKADDIDSHARAVLHELRIDALVHGNICKEDALDMLKMVESTLAAQISDTKDNDYHRALVLPAGTKVVYRPSVPSPENVNSAAVVFYQVGETTDHQESAVLSLFAHIAKVPIFSTLRTKEQLGYIVHSGIWSLNSIQGFRVVVQSERSAEYLEQRIENLWTESFHEHLKTLTQADFNRQRDALVANLKEKVKNMSQECNRYWHQIETGELDFHKRERQAELVSSLNKDDVIAFLRRRIHPDATERAKLSILMRSQRLQPAALERLIAAINDIAVAGREEVVDMLSSGKPTRGQVEDKVRVLYKDTTMPTAVQDALSDLAKKPELVEGAQELLEEDLAAFRRKLQRGPPIKPAADFKTDIEAHL